MRRGFKLTHRVNSVLRTLRKLPMERIDIQHVV